MAFLAVGWRLIPKDRKAQPTSDKRFEIDDYLCEAVIPSGSPFVGKTVQQVEERADGAAVVTAIIREGNRRYLPSGQWTLFEKDVLVLQADPAMLKPFFDQGELELVGAADAPLLLARDEELETVEAVVMAESPMLEQTSFDLHLRRRFEVNLLAFSRGAQRITTRLGRTRFQVGDVLVLQGHAKILPDTVAQLGCLPLAERYLTMGRNRPRLLPLVILCAGMALVTLKLLPVEVAFFIAAVLVVLLRLLDSEGGLPGHQLANYHYAWCAHSSWRISAGDRGGSYRG